MQFTTLAVAASLAAIVAASPAPFGGLGNAGGLYPGGPRPQTSTPSSSHDCNVENQHCCEQVQKADSKSYNEVFGLFSRLGSLTGGKSTNVGFQCSSLIGGEACTGKPV